MLSFSELDYDSLDTVDKLPLVSGSRALLMHVAKAMLRMLVGATLAGAAAAGAGEHGLSALATPLGRRGVGPATGTTPLAAVALGLRAGAGPSSSAGAAGRAAFGSPLVFTSPRVEGLVPGWAAAQDDWGSPAAELVIKGC